MKVEKQLQDDYQQMIWLACPIFFELLLRTLLGNIDQFMLSNYSSTAVAAVGNANQILNMLMLVLHVVCIASTIIIAQYIGAGKKGELSQLYTLTIALNVLFSIILSGIIFFQEPIMHLIKVPDELLHDTKIYFTVVASTFVFQGLFMSFAAIFRSNAMMRDIMLISIFANIVNVGGNFILINGFGDIPPLGVLGAAISTVMSRVISACIIVYLYFKKISVALMPRYIIKPDLKRISNLFKIGIPAAGDSISYNTMQLVMMSFINSYGANSSTVKAYVGMIALFVYMCSSAIAQATQIKVGYAIGAGQPLRAKKLVSKSVKTSVLISLIGAIILYSFSDSVFSIFTQDEQILLLIKQVMFIDIFLEIGRAVNMVMINSLLASGDTKYPVICAVFSMWMIAVPAGYLFGSILGYGIAGVWIGFTLDEWCRAVAFLIRWKSNIWQKKRIQLMDT